MKIFRWIMGIMVPYALAIVIIVVLRELQYRGILYFTRSGNYFYLVFLALKEFVVYFLLIFLSCVIIPTPKKYAAATSIILNIVIVIGVFIYAFAQPSDSHIMPSATVLTVGLQGSFIGLAAGTALAYAIFKNKGWDRPKPSVELQPIEQY